jgi:pimeloyl-ACP methyl ester carboxylesterase
MSTVHSAGVPIYYEVIGTGTPILLLHGFVSSFEANWGQTGWVDFLVAQGRQVVGMDTRGHGDSGKPHDPSAYDGNQIPGDVIAVMDAVGLQRTDVMGYSMGGRIAINLLARVPQRFNTVIAGGAGLRTAQRDQTAIIAALETDDVSTITTPTALFLRRFAESRVTDPTSLAGRDNDLKALAANTRSNSSVHYDPAERVTALRPVQTPVLAVVGDKDPVLSEAQLLIDTVPFGELVTLAGEDHLTTVRSPKYKEAVASFLNAHTLSAA